MRFWARICDDHFFGCNTAIPSWCRWLCSGQTGTGKTYTMLGGDHTGTFYQTGESDEEEDEGAVPSTFHDTSHFTRGLTRHPAA